jgi:hypothetical protein
MGWACSSKEGDKLEGAYETSCEATTCSQMLLGKVDRKIKNFKRMIYIS